MMEKKQETEKIQFFCTLAFQKHLTRHVALPHANCTVFTWIYGGPFYLCLRHRVSPWKARRMETNPNNAPRAP